MKLAKRQVYNYWGQKVTRPAVRRYGSGLSQAPQIHLFLEICLFPFHIQKPRLCRITLEVFFGVLSLDGDNFKASTWIRDSGFEAHAHRLS